MGKDLDLRKTLLLREGATYFATMVSCLAAGPDRGEKGSLKISHRFEALVPHCPSSVDDWKELYVGVANLTIELLTRSSNDPH